MKISDREVWQMWVDNNTDPYGRGIIQYAERWAELMESRMAGDTTLEACAGETSHEADTEGITGFMYSAAVAALASCWEHGEQLRRWHNLEIQIGDEGEKANRGDGILNPALLRLGAG